MDYTEIHLQHSGELATLTLNRPQKLNALTPNLIHEMEHALKKLARDKTCRVVVVTGAGRAFSAGVDLSVFENSKVEPGYDMHESGMEVMRLLEEMPQVCIAKVNGYCFTGAMELMMAFDLIYAAEEAKIGDTHSKWGILPKWGMTQRLARHVGLLKAKELSFTAEAITGKEAERIGLVTAAFPLVELDKKVDQLIQKILGNSADGIKAIKHIYNQGFKRTLSEGLQFELDYEVEISDHSEKLNNFKKS